MTDVVEELTPHTARERLVERLTVKGIITRPEVAAALLAVPRHEFAPAGTSLQAAYADDVVVTKKGADGKATSSISAPWLQAYMLETAQLKPGSRVLEIGSGGYNAALRRRGRDPAAFGKARVRSSSIGSGTARVSLPDID